MRVQARSPGKQLSAITSLVLEATNAGQKRVQITKLTVTDEKDQDLVKGRLAYVLGGQKKVWVA